METAFGILALIAAMGWLLLGLSRVHATWASAGQQLQDLQGALTAVDHELERKAQEIKQIGTELKTAREAVQKSKQQFEGRKHAAPAPPPPPPEIEVAAEFPSTRQERPYLALFRRDGEPGSGRPTREQVLVWSRDQSAATNRAGQVAQKKPGFYLEGVRMFSIPKPRSRELVNAE